ncbi:putative defense protein 3 isoform X2 [Lepisosteus oculatus]|uniref:putative defense protein 3 isoform X2 n=1 Tax=Lepisosteus oculatus TaxID=7918 RepID=UPI0003EA8FC1|nr:PREDICTED: putative defense protein Hdd11 isoform X2 [Lepisosteus oculatus]
MLGLLLPALSVLGLLGVSPPVTGLPNGAPTSACESMMPRHQGVQPQPPPPPYTIRVSTRTSTAGQPVQVTILGPDYAGVLLEARSGSDTRALGSWQTPPSNTKFLTCSGNQQGAITHSNTNIKNNSTVYTWITPSGPSSIFFMATVAQQRTVYWLNVKSEPLTISGVSLEGGASPVAVAGGLLFLLPSLLLTLLYSS